MDTKQMKQMEAKRNMWKRKIARSNAWKAERYAVLALCEAFRL